MKTIIMTIDQYKGYKNGELTLREIRTGKSRMKLDDIAGLICDDMYGEYGENRFNIIGSIGVTILTLLFLPDVIKLLSNVSDEMQLHINLHSDFISKLLQILSQDLIRR
jgi:hypothetical protein